MTVFVMLVGTVIVQADAPSDSHLPEISTDLEISQERAEPKAPETPPLESRSTAEWRKGLMAWRRQAVSAVPERHSLRETDLALLDRVRDGNAVSAIAALYKQERDLRVRMAYLRTLSHIETTRAVEMLVQAALADKDPRLQDLAVDGIAKMRNRKEAVELLARAIGNGKNRDRALEVLDGAELTTPVSPGELPDPALTTALIDSLWVSQTTWVPVEFRYVDPRPGPHPLHTPPISVEVPSLPSLVPSGVHRGWAYNRRLVPIKTLRRSPSVHGVLKRYAGEDYGYDQNAWRTWYDARCRNLSEEVP